MKSQNTYPKFLVLKIVFVYAFLSSLWILFSDQLLKLMTNDAHQLTELQTLKGWAFVLLTSGLLYGLVSFGVRSLQKSYNLLQAIIEGTTDAIFVKNLQGHYIMVNQACAQILGKPAAEILGKDDSQFMSLDSARKIMEADRTIMTTGLTQSIEEVASVNNIKSIYLSTKYVYRDTRGKIIGLIGIARDISDRQQAYEQMRQYAFYETLTGLPNRTFCVEQLGLVQRTSSGEAGLFALVYLDLDRFQMVKYSLGHQVAHQLLLAVVDRLIAYQSETAKSQTHKINTIAHVATDEFAILVEDLETESDAGAIANALQEQLAAPFDLNGSEVFTSASIGIVLSSIGYRQPEQLLQAADTAKNQAKALGNGRCVVFDTTMQAKALQRLQLDTDLRRALQRQEFLLHYQPIVSLSTNQTMGFEALVRWQHPQLGLVSPAEFIPLAEETGLIVPLGAWVLRQACRQLRWQQKLTAKVPLIISVNLSAVQLVQPGLLEQVDFVLQETGLSGENLKLEITETALMQNANRVTNILEQLKARQIRLSIDDFGTGYSSLNYLHSFPFDTMKIDRSFVSRMNLEQKNLEIIQTIIILAHNLEMELIAEGIETTEELNQLLAMHCEYGQGYLFSRPLDSAAAFRLISDFTSN